MLSQSALSVGNNANARGRLIFVARLPIDLIEIKEIIMIRAAFNERASPVHILARVHANSHEDKIRGGFYYPTKRVHHSSTDCFTSGGIPRDAQP